MNKLILGIVMVAMLVVCSAPASAINGPVAIDQLNRYEVVVPNGSYWLDWDKIGNTPVDFNVPNVNLYWVGLYNSAWMPPDTVSASWPNSSSPLPLRYPHTGPHSRYTGCGTTGIWYEDVTALTLPGQVNTFLTNGDGHGIAVPILYQDPDNPNSLDSWFYQGYDDARYGGCDGYSYCMTYTFNNVTATNHTHWTLMVAVTCADDGNIVFNNVNFLPNGYPASGKWYHVATNDVSGMVLNGNNVVKLRTNDQYFHPYWMWLVGYTPPQQKADLIVVGDPVIDPVTPRPDKDFAVSATILNQGDVITEGQFRVRLYVEGYSGGSYTYTSEPVGPLAKDGTIPVSFEDVNLPEGCYAFKVVADVYDAVDELDELNNESNDVDCQVGYVIVVENDDDFVALKAEAGDGLPTGSVTYDGGTDTYYIQDLTITNCAGDGIFIEGTTKNFVIKNCIIENCALDGSGVFLNDVTKGTITECTLQNNEAYGVELGLVPLDPTDPKNINVTCNTIYHNGMSTTKNGIDLIGFDCTVAYNHVIDNGEYGIYVHGNDSKIHNNTVKDNDNYGIKLYNSSGNDVYMNDLSNNNGVGVQGYDGWLGLPGLALNTWNSPTQVGYYYAGGTKTNFTGNYWDDYTGSDPDGDGIGNDAYALDGEAGATDSYPAMVQWRLCGDVNRDGVVNGGDSALLNSHLNWFPPWFPINSWAAEVDGNGVVNGGDSALLNSHLNWYPPWCPLNCRKCVCE